MRWMARRFGMSWVGFGMASIGFGLAFVAAPARSEDIVDVLRRSQQLRLESLRAAADGPRVQLIRQDFERLRGALQGGTPAAARAELQVINGPTLAETLHGRIVVANEALADLPEGERLFILAHEIGHVQGAHWAQMGRLYQRWVPAAVIPENTDPVAVPMGREASALAYRQEFAADAYALQALRQLQRPAEDAFGTFLRQGVVHDTATHPGTRKRVASLRAALAGGAAVTVAVVAAGSGSDAE